MKLSMYIVSMIGKAELEKVFNIYTHTYLTNIKWVDTISNFKFVILVENSKWVSEYWKI